MRPQAQAVFGQGVMALERNDLAAAEAFFRAVVENEARAHEAWNALAVVALRRGQPDIAEALARRALELERRNAGYLNTLGCALGELSRYGEAEEAFRRATKAQPGYAEGLFNLGKVLHKQGRLAESLKAFERSYAIAPQRGVLTGVAALHRLTGRPDLAAQALRTAPGGMDKILSQIYAFCLADLEGPARAIEWLAKEIDAHDDWESLRFNLATFHLGIGRWEEGWRDFYARLPRQLRRRAPRLADRLEGRRVLLRDEMGLGDVLFFLRFVPELKARGAKPTLECPPALAPLLSGNELLDALVPVGQAGQAAYDDSLWVGELPAALGAGATPPSIALRADPARRQQIAERLREAGPPPYLALGWRAGTDTLRRQEYGSPLPNALSKEVGTAALGEAVRGWRGTLVAVQRNPYPGDLDQISAAAGAKAHDFCATNANLVDMLALLDVVDEYVTVSNTNVHLRAALGKAARILVPRFPEWRWMYDAEASPWFPGFAVYRQPVSYDWSAPLARLRGDLGL